MAKSLGDILKGKDKRLEGVNSSKTVPGSTGKNPGVDYDSKAPDERKFVKGHDTEKWEGRAGNKDEVYNGGKIKFSLDDPKNAKLRPTKERVYEAVSCNESAKGVMCEMHGLKECPEWSPSKKPTLKEVLTKKTPAKTWIKDFEKSDAPQFAGKSEKKRKDMALAAYYSKQRDESYDIDEAKKHDDTDEEVSMVTTELRAIGAKVDELLKNLPDDMHVEPWVQAKLAMAKANISGIHDYILYKDIKEDTDQIGKPEAAERWVKHAADAGQNLARHRKRFVKARDRYKNIDAKAHYTHYINAIDDHLKTQNEELAEPMLEKIKKAVDKKKVRENS